MTDLSYILVRFGAIYCIYRPPFFVAPRRSDLLYLYDIIV
jgi:hypothetical protein